MNKKLSLHLLILLSIFCYNLKAQVGINVENPSAMLEVNGSVKFPNLTGPAPELGSILEAANEKGELRWAKNIATPYMLFIQSSEQKLVPYTEFNKDTSTLYSPIFSEESKSQAINTIDATFIGDNIIQIPNAGSYEISGYINYIHLSSFFNNSSSKIRFNLIVRASSDGGTTWTDIAGSRFSVFPVFNGSRTAISLQSITAQLPAHIVHLEQNSLIQYGFVKVSTNTDEQLVSGNFYIGSITDGMKYTNSLKITKQ